MMISDVPRDLRSGPVRLTFEEVVSPDTVGEEVPYYHFAVVNEDGSVVGHINFRVGDTRHVNMCAGHIGYGTDEKYRGHSYSYHACCALAPFVRRHYERVILTTDPDNEPSLRVIEKLGARFLDKIEVPIDDPAYAGGARVKKRFEWVP